MNILGGRAQPLGGAGAPQIENLLENLCLLGLERGPLCRRAGLEAECLAQPELRVPWSQVHRIFAVAEELRNDPLVGLHAAEAGSRDLLGYLAAAQPTVGEALSEVARLLAISADGLRIDIARRATTVARFHFPLAEVPSRHVVEYTVGLIVANLSRYSGRRFRPAHVRFAHAPSGALGEYERILNSAVRFRQPYTEIAVGDDVMAMRLDTGSRDAALALTEIAERRVRAATAASTGERVGGVLRAMLARGARPTPTAVASALGTSVRTLQRLLASEGTSLRDVRDEVRREWALERLGDASLTIARVSDEIGFADVAAFTKAFRRWTGDSPRAYRRTRGAGGR